MLSEYTSLHLVLNGFRIAHLFNFSVVFVCFLFGFFLFVFVLCYIANVYYVFE